MDIEIKPANVDDDNDPLVMKMREEIARLNRPIVITHQDEETPATASAGESQ
jgi:hypothetical protein